MKERPIIMSAESVRAILSGKKSQTRRVVKVQPSREFSYVGFGKSENYKSWGAWGSELSFIDPEWKTMANFYKFPYGKIGDRLWVRETWAKTPDENRVIYQADYLVHSPTAEVIDIPTGRLMPLVWKPSIHLPRKFSRISLEIIGVRVERLQDISQCDALEEGVTVTDYWTPSELNNRPFEEKWWDDNYFWGNYPQVVYSKLWNSINAKRGYSWESNPWVWVIEFKRVEP